MPDRLDGGKVEDAEGLNFEDFAKTITGFELYVFPPTVNRGAVANLLAELPANTLNSFRVVVAPKNRIYYWV